MSSASLPATAALRALAHPLRLDLLDLLRVHETLTAAECARLLETATKVCSYHLGVLAGQGLVVRADEPSADGRERPWRRAADEFDTTASPGSDQDQQARTAVRQVTAQRDLDLFTVFLEREPGEPAAWPSGRPARLQPHGLLAADSGRSCRVSVMDELPGVPQAS
jgi:predicted transcriptional regulator